MKSFLLTYTSVMFLSILIIGITSCGDEEPECIIPTASFELAIGNQAISGGTIEAEISVSTFGGFDFKYIDMYITLDDGRTVTLGVQNVEGSTEGLCLDIRTYSFEGSEADCFDLDATSTICNESDVEYIDAQGLRYTDFLQNGELTITDCNLEKNTISGSFSGNVRNGAVDLLGIDGTFTDILIVQ